MGDRCILEFCQEHEQPAETDEGDEEDDSLEESKHVPRGISYYSSKTVTMTRIVQLGKIIHLSTYSSVQIYSVKCKI